MNCESLRDNLYEYQDGSLSPWEQAAVERHLAGCPACCEMVERERQLSRSMSRGLERTVESVALDAPAQRCLARAVERRTADSRKRSLILFWRRPAFRLVATAVILLGAFWADHNLFKEKNSSGGMIRASAAGDSQEIRVHLSYSIPGYVFRREGNQVVDALTVSTVVADEAFTVKNDKSQIDKMYYEN
jgi:anti-sigma factor RsiW